MSQGFILARFRHSQQFAGMFQTLLKQGFASKNCKCDFQDTMGISMRQMQ